MKTGSRLIRGGLIALLLPAASTDLASESVTLTTYYPAPSGVYQRMITTGDTTLSRDGGGVMIGPAGALPAGTKVVVMGGRVGINTTAPAANLDVQGVVRIGSNAAIACGASTGGAMRYNSASREMEYCNEASWTSMSSTPKITVMNLMVNAQYAPGNPTSHYCDFNVVSGASSCDGNLTTFGFIRKGTWTTTAGAVLQPSLTTVSSWPGRHWDPLNEGWRATAVILNATTIRVTLSWYDNAGLGSPAGPAASASVLAVQ